MAAPCDEAQVRRCVSSIDASPAWPVDIGPDARGVQRPTQAASAEGRLAAAMHALLAGSSAAERAAGGPPSSRSAHGAGCRARGSSRAVELSSTSPTFSALVPNASTSTGARRLLSELTATAFQFAEVTAVEYRFDGSCAAFWAWLGGTCHADRRPG